MSELFSVSVAAVDANQAKLAVRSIHPDSGPPAGTATFALMLVFDPIASAQYSEFAKFHHLESSPLAEEMDLQNYLDPSWITANARAFVKSAKVAKGVLTVVPTHPAWISHLRKGMRWETAAYDGGPGAAAEPRVPVKGEPVPSRDPAAGFRVGAPKQEDVKIPEAFIPLHGANRYVAHPVITDPAEMAAAAAKMLGQPVLMTPKRGIPEVGTIIQLGDGWMSTYYESPGGGGWGSGGKSYSDLKSMGRAWLKERLIVTETEPAPSEPAAPAKAKKPRIAAKTARKTAKKISKKVPKKKAGRKGR